MIELNAVTKRYGLVTAVDNVSLSINQDAYMALDPMVQGKRKG
jgi:hypothetical protein